MAIDNPPKKIGAIFFPGFQLLDIAGPLDALNILSATTPLELCILASSLSPVSTAHTASSQSGAAQPSRASSNFSQSIVPTHTFKDAPKDLDVLIIPGGIGARDAANVQDIVDYVKSAWNGGKGSVRWILTVCTGSAILAKTGILDGRQATSNKKSFEWVKSQGPDVKWVAKARWVADGNVWTASGVSAGIDLIFAWIGHVWGEDVADLVADSSEYERNKEAGNDRFAERWSAV